MKNPFIFKQLFLAFILITFSYTASSQEIVNIIYVGDSGITEDVKQAHSFIAIKQYPGSVYERLDYRLGGPLTMLRTYNDTNLANLDGKFLTYDGSGALVTSGQYYNNQKTGDWHYYNDTGKVVMKETYDKDVLTKSENPDTVKETKAVKYGDEKETEFKKGKNAWSTYLENSLLRLPFEVTSLKGKVHVMFIINTEGKLTDIYLRKSAHFALDEEALKIISNSSLWNPAFQNGHNVNAFRVQPFTFRGMDE
ncbi:MAG: TonB family protein [Bacteroidota bacterium]